MTLSNPTNLVTYTGNGVATEFAYTFTIPDADSIEVTLYTIATGVTGEPLASELYSVTGLGEEGGGEVTYPLSGDPLASTHKINIRRVVALEQGLNLTNQSAYFPEELEEQLDRTIMMIQQLNEEVGRALKVSLSTEPGDIASLLASVTALLDFLDEIVALAAVAGDLATVAGIESEITTLAAVASSIETLAAAVADAVMTTDEDASGFGFVLDEDDLASDSATKLPTQQSVKAYVDAEITAAAPQLLHVRDEKASGTDGGTFTGGAWRTRDLGTVKTNEISGASVASNQITLPAGTYEIFARTPAMQVSTHAAKLYNVTDASDVVVGSMAQSTTSDTMAQTDAIVLGRFTLAATKVLELQHRCGNSRSTYGLGRAASFGVVEVYAEAWIKKVA